MSAHNNIKEFLKGNKCGEFLPLRNFRGISQEQVLVTDSSEIREILQVLPPIREFFRGSELWDLFF